MVPLIESEVVTDHLNGNYATNDSLVANQWDRGSISYSFVLAFFLGARSEETVPSFITIEQ